MNKKATVSEHVLIEVLNHLDYDALVSLADGVFYSKRSEEDMELHSQYDVIHSVLVELGDGLECDHDAGLCNCKLRDALFPQPEPDVPYHETPGGY